MPVPRRATGVVIAWMPVSQRSATIADRLGYDLHLVGRPGFRTPWTAPLAYPIAALQTAWFLARRRPRAIIVAVPPIIAPLVVLPIAAVLRASLALDVHSGAMLDRRWRWSVGILKQMNRRATTAIVTLPSLAVDLAAPRGRVIVVPDPLPALSAQTEPAPDDRDSPLVVAVCGWGDDEPIDALVAAARGESWNLTLTGRARRALDLPPNVSLSGFLSTDNYVSLVSGADAVVVLTTREDTLLSGAWEALALGRPLIVSDTKALRQTFGDGVTYVAPHAGAITDAVQRTLADPSAAQRTRALRTTLGAANDLALEQLGRLLRPRADQSPR